MNARAPTAALNPQTLLQSVTQAWDSDIVQQLSDYIAVPAKSPAFDADWAVHGHIDARPAPRNHPLAPTHARDLF